MQKEAEKANEKEDLVERSNKKVKIRVDCLLARDFRSQNREENQTEELGTSKHKQPYRDFLVGETNPHTSNQEMKNQNSYYTQEDSDQDDEEEEADCPTIHLTVEDKQRLCKPWPNNTESIRDEGRFQVS